MIINESNEFPHLCVPLTIKDLFEVNVKLTFIVEWKVFGLALKLKAITLDKIRSNCCHDVQLTKALAAWLKGEDRPRDSPPPHWGEVIDPLKSHSLNTRENAEKLTRMLTGDSSDQAEPSEEFTSVDNSKIDPNSVSETLNYIHTLMYKWFHLGLSLGLHYSTLKCIEASHHLGVENQINVLQKWLNEVDYVSERGPPSWRSLALALDCPLVREHQVACSIQDERQISLNPVEKL